MKPSLIFLFALFTLWMTGCSHLAPKQPTGLRAQSFWADQKFRRVFLTKLNGKLSLTYKGKNERVSGKGLVVAELSDRVRLELRDPIGRVRYLAALNGTAMTVFYPSEKLAYHDAAAGARYLKKFLGAELPFENLVELFIGVVPESFRPKALDTWEWDAKQGAYVGEAKTKTGKFIVVVDPDLAILKKLTLDVNGETVTVDYAEPDTCCEHATKPNQKYPVKLAAVVTVTQMRTQSSMEVEWNKIHVFEEPYNGDAFRIVLPEGVRKISLD